jgi:hypothetical protein
MLNQSEHGLWKTATGQKGPEGKKQSISTNKAEQNHMMI